MHISEGFLPPLHAAVWTIASAPFVIHGVREVKRTVEQHPDAKLLLAAAGAFSFVMSAIKLPSVSGSSSHPTGAGVGAIVFRPPVMAVMGTLVLLFQALLLAHGGLTTLGANVFSMAVVGPWVAFTIFQIARRWNLDLAVFFGVACANLATYVVTATQLALAFPDEHGGVLGSWIRFVSIFAFTQVPLAIVEGIIGVLLLRTLRRWSPDLLSQFQRGTQAVRRPEVRADAGGGHA